jgi:hypothetical protein
MSPALTLWLGLLLAQSKAALPTPPPALRPLLKTGDVTVEYVSDPEFVAANIGKCHFSLKFEHTWKYRYSRSKKDGKTTVKVTPHTVTPTVEMHHTIRLPIRYASQKWSGRLLRHELDHVAVSSDPRPALLLEYLATHLPPIKHELADGETADSALYKRLVNEALDRRKDAVVELIQQNYKRLDEVSQHGTVPIPDRAGFFADLYSKERLASLEFPFAAEALGVFETDPYRNAELLYLPTDPTGR